MNNPQRGTVLQVPVGENAGLLFFDGQQVPFQLAHVWQSPIAPAVNQTVEVTLDDGGKPARIVVVDAQTLAKEKLEQFAGLAGDHGQQAAEKGKALFQVARARMGLVTLIVAAVLLIGWFFFPALSINVLVYSRNISVSEILGFQLSYGAVPHFGFFSLLGMAAVFAPWAVVWLRTRWASLLYAAPLVMIIYAFLYVHYEIHSLASKDFGSLAEISNYVSFSFGFWLVFLLSLTLAIIGFKRYSSHT